MTLKLKKKLQQVSNLLLLLHSTNWLLIRLPWYQAYRLNIVFLQFWLQINCINLNVNLRALSQDTMSRLLWDPKLLSVSR